MPVAEPAFARTEATPELPDVELKVTETFTPDWQLRPRENGVFAATEPAVGNIAGLIVARGIVWFALAAVTEQVTPRTGVFATVIVLAPLLSVYPVFRTPVL